MRIATQITLSDTDREKLLRNTRSNAVSAKLCERSSIILLSAEGLENRAIAQKLNIPPNKVGKWRNRFAAGLKPHLEITSRASGDLPLATKRSGRIGR